MPDSNQPLIGENLTGTLAPSYPTPAEDVDLTGLTERNLEDYVQSIYGTPPPQNTNPGYMAVNEVPVDWRFMRRKYVKDRSLENTYNYSIAYSAEAKDYPIFTRDYIVRRSLYSPKTKLSSMTGVYLVMVTSPGSGYSQSTTTASASGGTGSGAQLYPIVDNGTVSLVVVLAEGNYTAAPTVTITSTSDGSGATATAFIQPSTALLVKEDVIRTPDSEMDGLFFLVRRIYETLPGPILQMDHIDETSGIITNIFKQLVAKGTVSSGVIGAPITDLQIKDGGHNYTGNGTLVFSGGGGTGATGTFTFSAPSPSGKIGSVELTSGGGGYTSVPTAGVTGGGGSGAVVAVQIVGVPVASLELVSSDSTFTDVPPVVITDAVGMGSGATAIAALTPTTVDSAPVDTGGSGYTTASVSFTGGGGTGATGTVNLTGDVVTSITITNAGSGYTSRPTATITGDGTGATAHAELTGTSVAGVTLTNSGNNYQSAGVSVFQGFATANVVATINPTTVASLTLTSAGSGYSSPTLSITGGGGSGATGTAELATGTVTSVTLTNPGSGYTSPPTITTSGGGGSGAIIAPILGSVGYRTVEDLTSCKSMVTIASVDLSTLPAKKRFPISFRVQFSSTQAASLVYATATSGAATVIDVGLNELTINGGSGPALAYMDEYYFTDSQYSAWLPDAFSVSGRSITQTLWATFSSTDPLSARVYTFRLTPFTEGTTAGVLDISSSQKPYGIRKVIVIGLTTNQ